MIKDSVSPSIREKDKMIERRLKKRYSADKRFRLYGFGAISLTLMFLYILLGTIIFRGWSAFMQTEILLTVHVTDENPKTIDYQDLARQSLQNLLLDTEASRDNKKRIRHFLSEAAEQDLKKQLVLSSDTAEKGQSLWVTASATVDQWYKGNVPKTIANGSMMNEQELSWLNRLNDHHRLRKSFNKYLFTSGDSRQPELAGFFGAMVGTIYALLITIILSVPLGVAAAVYLEEFAKKNRWIDLIEVNINNLAAVPSIVFGLLGLEIFLNLFGMNRSSPFVGGLCLTLVTLPTIIITSRVALQAVPPWIREAASGLGASQLQVIVDHVLPLAMPGILTGSIISMARAIGETAPLLMVGMVAFIVTVPKSPFDSATVLPVQIYLWASSPERAFVEKTSATIMVLLILLALMNAAAIYMRKKFEQRW